MGRPSRWPVLMETHVDQATADGLKAAALREGRPVADVVRRAIANELGRMRPAHHNTEEEGT